MLGAKGPNATYTAKVSDETDLTDPMYKVQGVESDLQGSSPTTYVALGKSLNLTESVSSSVKGEVITVLSPARGMSIKWDSRCRAPDSEEMTRKY